MVKIYDINGNSIKQVTQKNMNSDLSKELKRITDKMKENIESLIHDTGYFRNFAENFEKGFVPNFYAKNIALFVERDLHADGKAFLGVSVLHPTMAIDARTYFINGNRQEILNYINKSDFSKKLEDTILELSEELKKK